MHSELSLKGRTFLELLINQKEIAEISIGIDYWLGQQGEVAIFVFEDTDHKLLEATYLLAIVN